MFTRAYGLADFFGPEFNNAMKDRFVSNAAYFDFVSRLPPSFAPGERNQYCNGCYIALGYTRREGDGTLRSNLAMHGVTGSAAGGGYSTVLDLLTYATAVRAGPPPNASGRRSPTLSRARVGLLPATTAEARGSRNPAYDQFGG